MKCLICQRTTDNRCVVVAEKRSHITKMRWEYPLCNECFERLRKHLEEVSKDVGDKWCDSV